MMQEPYEERKGYNIGHPGYRLVRGGHTMTAMRRDTQLEFSELHQQKIFPSARNGSVRVDALRQSHQRHPGGGILRARP